MPDHMAEKVGHWLAGQQFGWNQPLSLKVESTIPQLPSKENMKAWVRVGKCLQPSEGSNEPGKKGPCHCETTASHNNTAFGYASSHSQEPHLNSCIQNICQGWNSPVEIQVSLLLCVKAVQKELVPAWDG